MEVLIMKRFACALLAALMILTLLITDLPVSSAEILPCHIFCENCETRNGQGDIINEAYPGDTVQVIFKRMSIPDGKYTTKEILSDDVTVNKDPNGFRTFVMPNKEVHLAAELLDRKSGLVDLIDNDRVNANFEMLDSLVFTQSVPLYESAGGNGSFYLDLNQDGKYDVVIALNQSSKTAAAERLPGSDKVKDAVTVQIHGSDGLDWSRQYKSCTFKVARVYCTVSFRANGGTGTMKSVRVQKGKQYTLPECEFKAPKDKIFKQWKQGKPGSVIVVNKNIALTAIWKNPGNRKVTFCPNGANAASYVQTAKYGSKIKLTVNRFERKGYIFRNWNTKKNGTGQKYTNNQTLYLKKNLTLYAQWSKISLTLNKVVVRRSANKLKLKAQLKVGGKIQRKKTVTFIFNGKKYMAKTNSNGYATVTIPKSVLSKLKVGQTVTIKAIYKTRTVAYQCKVKY